MSLRTWTHVKCVLHLGAVTLNFAGVVNVLACRATVLYPSGPRCMINPGPQQCDADFGRERCFDVPGHSVMPTP